MSTGSTAVDESYEESNVGGEGHFNHIGGAIPPTFSLTGDTIPEAGIPGSRIARSVFAPRAEYQPQPDGVGRNIGKRSDSPTSFRGCTRTWKHTFLSVSLAPATMNGV